MRNITLEELLIIIDYYKERGDVVTSLRYILEYDKLKKKLSRGIVDKIIN